VIRTLERTGWPEPADFAAPPSASDLARWVASDREARPARLTRVQARLAQHGLDVYFGVRTEHMRYLTGFNLRAGEEKVAGHSGRFFVGAHEVVVLADTRYSLQARREAPDARIEPVTHDVPARWPELLRSLGARRVAMEAAFVSRALWGQLEAAAPDVELIPVEGWLEADRAVKEPAELERVAAACAVADRALAALLPVIRPGVTERELALRLEWLIRTGGAEALAFDVACLTGPEAALPHGSPSDRPVLADSALLFDFGAQVAGYRSDMTRTLFVGEPVARDLGLYEVVLRSQQAAMEAVAAAVRESHASGAPLPNGRAFDAIARGLIDADGRWPPYGHGLGHGIGLATHELPTLSRSAPETPIPSPTVFSIEPGIYVEGETGIRIEDLVSLDVGLGRVDRLTHFPRDVLAVGVV
jgi:Xaa-Pro aminopeptidase